MSGKQTANGSGPVVALAGGVGAARFLSGLVQVVPPRDLVIVGNTGDDCEFYGVHVSPDLDIVTYTLAGIVDPKRGYGITGDGFEVVSQLERLGHATWFRLGDRDLASCLHRTLRLREGASLSEVVDELRRSLSLECRILPMSDAPCPTLIELRDGRVLHFEEYLVRDGAPDEVRSVDLSAAAAAEPAPEVIELLRSARAILFCPSNPVVSIGPILELPGVRKAVRESAARVVAVSPIVGGAPIKGPADRLLRAVGAEVSARGVAELYRDCIDGMVVDERDADQAASVRALGLRCSVVDTLMVNPSVSAKLAEAALELAEPE